MKKSTCFKGTAFCIDLILTNRKYSFKHTESYETGIGDHHHHHHHHHQCLSFAFKINNQKCQITEIIGIIHPKI